MSCCGKKRETWVAKQNVVLWKFRGDSEESCITKNFETETEFYVRKSKKIKDNHNVYWKFETKQCCGGFRGFASKFYFYKKDFELPDEQEPWYFGELTKMESKECLLNEQNGDGAFLIRFSKGKFVLSLKYTDRDREVKVVDYRIHRTLPEEYKGDFYVDGPKTFKSLKSIVETYTKERGPFKTQLTDICMVPNPAADTTFRAAMALIYDGDTWTIKKGEIKIDVVLGSGNFGTVAKGMLRDTIPVAIKTLKENKDASNEDFQRASDDFKKETQLMKKLNHPNLVKMYGIQSESLPFQLVMELCEGSIKEHLDQFRIDDPPSLKLGTHPPTYDDLREWCEHIALGMDYLESKGVVHRDLAARNVLLSKHKRAKVADFGLSFEDEEESNEAGKFPVMWSAPEIIVKKGGKKNKKKFSHLSDVWSFGITCHEILSFGKRPYRDIKPKLGKGREALAEFLRNKNTMDEPKEYFSMGFENDHVKVMFKEIVKPCWAYDPKDRPNFHTLYERIRGLGMYGDGLD